MLYPQGRSDTDIESLDKAKRYRVLGIVLEQNYGTVAIWVKEIVEIKRHGIK